MKKKLEEFNRPIDLIKDFQQYDLPKDFCIIPFINLIFNPNGDVGVCRQKGTEHVVGNITKDSIDDIWNGPFLKKWRKEFLTGEIQTCKNEIKRDACNLSIDNYSPIWPDIDLKEHQTKPMLKFTANFNGKCNLRCKMCHIWTMQNGLYDQINFWEKAENNFFPYIKEMELLSGEPFIQSDTYRLIETVSKVNPDCQWSFTTNAHWKFNNTIKSYLDKIYIKNIIVSIDSLNPETYKNIRIGGDLNVVLENLQKLHDYDLERKKRGLSPLNLNLHFLVMKDNWKELDKVLDFVDKMNFKVTLNNLYEPVEYAISSLPEKEQISIIYYYLENYSWRTLARMMTVILAIASDLSAAARAEALLAIKKRKDQSREVVL